MSNTPVLSVLLRGLRDRPPAEESCSLILHGGVPEIKEDGGYNFPGSGEIHGDQRLLALSLAIMMQSCPGLGRILRVALQLDAELRNTKHVQIAARQFPVGAPGGASKCN